MTRGTRKRRKREYECESRGEGGRESGEWKNARCITRCGEKWEKWREKGSARVVSVCETRRKG